MFPFYLFLNININVMWFLQITVTYYLYSLNTFITEMILPILYHMSKKYL